MTTTLTLPDNVFRQIEERAHATGTSVDAQATDLLTKALARKARETELMGEIRKDREMLAARGVFLTDDALTQAKN